MMRYIFILGWMFFFVSCATHEPVEVEFYLVGSSLKEVVVEFDDTEEVLKVDRLGYGKLTFGADRVGYAGLKFGKDRVSLFLEQGKPLRVYIYGDKVKENIRFEGEGAQKNIYLNSKPLRDRVFVYVVNEEEFLDRLNHSIETQYAYLDSMAFDAAFTRLERNRIKFTAYSVLENYPLYHAWCTGKKDYSPDTNYLKRVKSLLKEEPALFELKAYREGMAALVSLLSTSHFQDFDAYKKVMAQMKYVEENILDERLVAYLIDRFATRYLLGSGVDEFMPEVLSFYDKYVKDSVYIKRFYDLYDRSLKIVAGQQALDFALMDVNGKLVKSRDLRGQYVLLNIWATWGAPCRSEIPCWNRLVEKFQNREVVFVAISCDEDRVEWERCLREEMMLGIQLYMGIDNELKDFYMLRGIPRFILIDPEGKIVDSDFTRPSDPASEKFLESLLLPK